MTVIHAVLSLPVLNSAPLASELGLDSVLELEVNLILVAE